MLRVHLIVGMLNAYARNIPKNRTRTNPLHQSVWLIRQSRNPCCDGLILNRLQRAQKKSGWLAHNANPYRKLKKSPGVSIDESQEEIYSSPLLVPVESGVRSKQAEEVFSMRVKGGEPTPGDLSKPPFTRSIDEISEEEKAA